MIKKKSIKYCFNNHNFKFEKEWDNCYVTFAMLTINYFESFDYLDFSKKLKIATKKHKCELEILFIGENKLIFILEELDIDKSYEVLIDLIKRITYEDINSLLSLKISVSALNLQFEDLNKKFDKNLYFYIYKLLKKIYLMKLN